MIVMSFHFSDEEITDFFARNNYNVEDREFGRWQPVAHNKTEWVTSRHPAVIVQGSYVLASQLFEYVVYEHAKRMFTPANLETKRAILRHFKKLTK